MTPDPTLEVEAFVRWLAMSPHKLDAYAADPEGFLEAANVGAEARTLIKAYGVEGLRSVVRDTAGQIFADPDAGILRRDDSVRGYGSPQPGAGEA